jgi:hypothetical protein
MRIITSSRVVAVSRCLLHNALLELHQDKHVRNQYVDHLYANQRRVDC